MNNSRRHALNLGFGSLAALGVAGCITVEPELEGVEVSPGGVLKGTGALLIKQRGYTSSWLTYDPPGQTTNIIEVSSSWGPVTNKIRGSLTKKLSLSLVLDVQYQ